LIFKVAPIYSFNNSECQRFNPPHPALFHQGHRYLRNLNTQKIERYVMTIKNIDPRLAKRYRQLGVGDSINDKTKTVGLRYYR